MKKFDHELVVCIVNSGFSDAVMDAAREVGARGGTVITAKGTANKEAEAFFKIFIQPEKEMVLILVPNKIKEDVLHALYRAVGLNTPGQGIAFALPVDNVLGLTTDSAPKPEETPAAEQSEEQ
jgi:nitrogen regulatory protein PII